MRCFITQTLQIRRSWSKNTKPAEFLTNDDQYEEEGGHTGRDVEHVADVPSQLVHVLHVGNQDGRQQEPDGDAQLENRRNVSFNGKFYQRVSNSREPVYQSPITCLHLLYKE